MKYLIYSIPGYACFLYLLFPFRLWEPFVFPNQIEPVVFTVFFACILLLFSLLKAFETNIFQINKADLILIVYGIYMLIRLKYPLEKEYLFQFFSGVCIYLYFRNFPEKYLMGLFLLLPLAGVTQIVYGTTKFTMPWQNISHIGGIFNNTGLFGGFIAMGFVVCAGMFFFHNSGKQYLKFIVFIALGISLAIQVYASGSRASWIAAFATILFLLYRFIPKWKIQLNHRWIRYFIAFCLLVLFIFFSKHLYDLKKDSADGRLLIGMVSLEMVKETPVFGSGIGGFRAEYMNRQAAYFRTHPDSPYRMNADDVETPFNEFLKILIEQGIIGLLLFGCVLYCLSGLNNLRSSALSASSAFKKICSSSLILFILLFGLFSYPFDKLPFVVVFVFSIAILSSCQSPVFIIRIRKMNCLRIPLLIALCFVLGIFAVEACCYAKSCLTWNRAMMHYAFDEEESLSQLRKLYPKLENNPEFLTVYGKTLSFSKHFTEAAPVLEKAVQRQPFSTSYIELGKSYEATGFPDKALACWERAGLMVPSRFAPLYLTMKLHFKNKEYGKAQACAGQLLTKKIKIDNPEIDGMKRDARNIANFRPPPE